MATSQNIERRATSFKIILIVIFSVLALRLAYLQLIQGSYFYAQAEDNRINFYTIGAPRGKIITADGKILVSNKMAYSASIRTGDLKDPEKFMKTVNKVIDILHLNRLEVMENLAKSIVDGEVVLKANIKPEEKALITANEGRLPGVSIVEEKNALGQVEHENLIINIRLVSTKNLLNSCKTVSELLGLNYESLLTNVVKFGAKKSGESLKIKRSLTQEEMVILEELRPTLPGVVVEKISIRDYVYGSTAAHMIGYVGAITEDELKTRKDKGYRNDDLIGKIGLERQFEEYLRGQDGREEIEVDSQARKIRTLGVNSPLPGSNLLTNIDLGLQMKAEQLLDETLLKLKEMAKKDSDMRGGPTGGAVIIMNPKNGKVLAMTSRPNFDLNLFAGGISSDLYRQLNSPDANKPFVNRAIMQTLPPGSIFKLVSASTYLEEKIIDEHSTVYDANGRYTIGRYTFDNWARKTHGGYGSLNVVQAIAHSNNIFFYSLAHRLFKMDKDDAIPTYAKGFGLGKLTGIDLPGEEEGLVPDTEWKKKVYKHGWQAGELLHLSIGQSDLRTTGIQLLNYVSAIANGGKLYQPYIVERIETYDGLVLKQFEPKVIGRLPISDKTLNLLRRGMEGVASYGTAGSQLGHLSVKVAGKTGTAQNNTAVSANHGWFAGYAPAEDPEIAILVLIEHGSSSSYTVPIAKELIKYYFGERKKAAESIPQSVVDPNKPNSTVGPGTTVGQPGMTPGTTTGDHGTGTPDTSPSGQTTQNQGTITGSQHSEQTPGQNTSAGTPGMESSQLSEELKKFYNETFSSP